MRRIEFCPGAARDLAEAHAFIARDNPTAARMFVESVRSAANMLAEFPGAGHRRDDVSDPRYRFWRVQSHLLAYRFDEATLTIIRLLHGARDIRSAL